MIGFVQLLDQNLMRVQMGFLLTLAYTIALTYFRPYKRKDVESLALCAQIALLGLFFGAMNIRLFASLDDVAEDVLESSRVDLRQQIMGFDNQQAVEVVMVIFNLLSISTFVLMTIYSLRTNTTPRTIRLSGSSQLPELGLEKAMTYHLYLSYIWSSGQDQVATIKRQLQLLLPGIAVFLECAPCLYGVTTGLCP